MGCRMTKRWLTEKGITFTEIDVDTDLEAREYLKTQNKLSLPQIESSVGDWYGFRPDQLAKLVG